MSDLRRAGALALAISALGSPSVMAQDQKGSSVMEEVVVSATRKEESAQDVSVSVSVFNQKQLDEANISNPSDLANYTPSLSANNRFGADNASFSIRGFSKELRTTASVGVYFADIVAPRGANAQQSGDGATPGDLFDLASIQVLKGPQGTLFGRNTTGGAVLIVPQKPTDEFEGSLELTYGDYDLFQQRLIVNAPVTDSFKVRLAIDNKKQDGYLNNFSGIGPDEFANTDYTAYRLSMLLDITDSVENYTILKYIDSSNNGYPGKVQRCSISSPFAFVCQSDLDRRAASGNDGFYDVYNSVPDPVNEQTLGQIINTTTWVINDDLTLKNNISYAELETRQRTSLFGENWVLSSGEPMIFQQVGLADDLPTTDQYTVVEELQLQGLSFDGRLDWQMGLYYEHSRPNGPSGAQSPAFIQCDQTSITSGDPNDFRCNKGFVSSIGAVSRLEGGVEYINQAAYMHGVFDLTERLSVTAGIRYTYDKTIGKVKESTWDFPSFVGDPNVYPITVPVLPFPAFANPQIRYRNPEQISEAPTGILGLDFKPTETTLLYAKYTRGYRQGSVNIAGTVPTNPDGSQKAGLPRHDIHDEEKVDTYEIGSKNEFEFWIPGTFNIAAFYNDFTDQQIQYGYLNRQGVGTTAIVNAGKSKIWGVEADTVLYFPGDVILRASYSHLDTEVLELEEPVLDGSEQSLFAPGVSVSSAVGEPLSYVPENQVVATLSWVVPVPYEVGEVTTSVTYVYTDEQQGLGRVYSPLAVFPQFELWNLNLSWNAIFGSGLDASAFVTNAKDEEYPTFINGVFNSAGLEAGAVGQPRMWGFRLKYNF